MTFNSFSYVLFLPAVYLIFYFTTDRWRWMVLLAASYVFYASFKAPYLVAVLSLVTGISYVCGLRLAAQHDESIRKRWLWIGISACVAILGLLKYLPFLESATNSVYGLNNTLSSAIIIIGVSYFTFQAISYLADIYLGIVEPEGHLGHFALYVSFFPKLLQGPIERAGDLLPQLKKPYRFDYNNVRAGLVLFVWGLFKKIVIADRLSEFVNAVYDNVPSSTPLTVILATYFFALQIYYDFSGYTDMALGTARLFNINLSQNFNNPYLATSVADFWRRWHISFSRWILDYIFKPLQMQWRNLNKLGTACALMITFLVSGIWHGAAWGFVIWGGLHGTYLALSVYSRPWQKRIYKTLRLDKTRFQRWFQTFIAFHLVCFAWIFFRANTLGDALTVVYKISHFTFSGINLKLLRNTLGGMGMSQADLGIFFLSLTFVALISILDFRANTFENLFNSRRWVRWLFYIVLTLFVILFAHTEYVPYLYFQF